MALAPVFPVVAVAVGLEVRIRQVAARRAPAEWAARLPVVAAKELQVATAESHLGEPVELVAMDWEILAVKDVVVAPPGVPPRLRRGMGLPVWMEAIAQLMLPGWVQDQLLIWLFSEAQVPAAAVAAVADTPSMSIPAAVVAVGVPLEDPVALPLRYTQRRQLF